MSIRRTIASSFFDGFGPGGLFVRMTRLGSPTRVFADEEDFERFNVQYERLRNRLLDRFHPDLLNDRVMFEIAVPWVTPAERRLLAAVLEHASILSLSAATAETVDALLQTMETICARALQFGVGGAPTGGGELAHRVTKA